MSDGDEVLRVLLRSDAHHDSPECNRELEYKHLEKAKELGAVILDAGDMLDVMNTRKDPRRELGGKMPEHEVPNYLDVIVQETANHYAPYAHLWAVMGRGNHETALTKHLNTDLTERIVGHLRQMVPDSRLQSGGYGGWVKFRLNIHNTKVSKTLHYYHGSAGRAPVTRGTIQTQRKSRAHPDSHIIWTGHIHTAGLVPWERWRITRYNKVYKDIQWHVTTPGYKDDVGDGHEGFGVERLGNEPRAQGCAWLKFIWDRRAQNVIVKPELDLEPS